MNRKSIIIKPVKRPARRIPNFEVIKEEQANVAKRLRQAIIANPKMLVIEFLQKSKFKPVDNKQIVELIKTHFGDLSIGELKTKHLNYFFGIYTKDPKVREEVIKEINKDPLRQEYRIIRQRIDFVNKYKENKGFRQKVNSAIAKTGNTRVGKVFGDFKLRQLSDKESAFMFLQKYGPDLSFNEIKELIKYYS